MKLFSSEVLTHFTDREIRIAGNLLDTVRMAVENVDQARLREQYWLRGTVGSAATEQAVSTPPQIQTEPIVQNEVFTRPQPQPSEQSQTSYIEAITNPEPQSSRADAEREARKLVDEVYRQAGLDFPTESLKFEEPAGV